MPSDIPHDYPRNALHSMSSNVATDKRTRTPLEVRADCYKTPEVVGFKVIGLIIVVTGMRKNTCRWHEYHRHDGRRHSSCE